MRCRRTDGSNSATRITAFSTTISLHTPGTALYPDGYVKFLMFGGSARDIPPNFRIFNKVGDAYGFLTDAAYIVDFDNGVEFLLAATVYTNENATFNDNQYEYDEIGLPFLRELGQAIYELELERERPARPDLSRFIPSEERPDREQESKSE